MEAQLLTHTLPEDVFGWWASEKYDGVRAIWSGYKLLTRHGKNIQAPAWFTAWLPKGGRLDGELWIGRGKFDELQSVMRSKDGDWSSVKYMVFDLAGVGAFEDRYKTLQRLAYASSHIKVVSHRVLRDHAELAAMEDEIVTNGGEGCVIRRPGCLYRPGRCGDVIKVKRLVEDADRWQG
jgi:DNA ligase-1